VKNILRKLVSWQWIDRFIVELCELEARLQSGDSVTAQHNAHVVL